MDIFGYPGLTLSGSRKISARGFNRAMTDLRALKGNREIRQRDPVKRLPHTLAFRAKVTEYIEQAGKAIAIKGHLLNIADGAITEPALRIEVRKSPDDLDIRLGLPLIDIDMIVPVVLEPSVRGDKAIMVPYVPFMVSANVSTNKCVRITGFETGNKKFKCRDLDEAGIMVGPEFTVHANSLPSSNPSVQGFGNQDLLLCAPFYQIGDPLRVLIERNRLGNPAIWVEGLFAKDVFIRKCAQ